MKNDLYYLTCCNCHTKLPTKLINCIYSSLHCDRHRVKTTFLLLQKSSLVKPDTIVRKYLRTSKNLHKPV